MTDVSTILAAESTSFVIAIVLYAATYLSFVQTLKYPRNWLRLRFLAVCPTIGLAVLMLLYVSLTAGHIDIVTLVAAAGFVSVLFYIIAAPAIAFKPSSRVIEFLARYGESAGLWMLVPAVILSYLIPDTRLYAIFASAMFIELAWSIRRFWAGRQRRAHKIEGPDLAVLEMQADGEVEKFARRHGIRELTVAGDVVTWRGCDMTTSPCPLNLYVNRLGLNTAPCCRERMQELYLTVSSWLEEMGAVYWLEGGTLLGAVRDDGALLPWEDDVDVSVLSEGSVDWDVLAAGVTERGKRDGYFVDIFERSGFIAIFHAPSRWPPLRWENYRLRGEVRLDLTVYRAAKSAGKPVLERQPPKGGMPPTDGGGYGIPRDLVLPTAKVAFLGREFPCPRKVRDYLRVLYGDFNQVDYSYVDAGPAKARRDLDAATITIERETA